MMSHRVVAHTLLSVVRSAMARSTHPLYPWRHLHDSDLFAYTLDDQGRCASDALARLPLWQSDSLVLHSVPLPPGSARRPRLQYSSFSPHEDRTLGAVMGMLVGDSLGAPFEFLTYLPDGLPASLGTDGVPLLHAKTDNRFRLRPGQWTDDSAMGLCLLDSLLAKGAPLQPVDLLLRFCAWWWSGYNNAFGETPLHSVLIVRACSSVLSAAAFDAVREDRLSVGLGNNTSAALHAFRSSGAPAAQGDSAGNGSLIRLAPVCLLGGGDSSAAVAAARAQSLTTHAHPEATGCAEALAWSLCAAVRAPPGMAPAARKGLALEALATYPGALPPSVRALVRGEAEAGIDPERDWRWRSASWRYAAGRAAAQPGYVGSYCMDALAMALHCIHCTDSFAGAVVCAVNHRSDADSVAAIAGTLAGAIYGLRDVPDPWVAAVERWDGGGSILQRAHALFHKPLADVHGAAQLSRSGR